MKKNSLKLVLLFSVLFFLASCSDRKMVDLNLRYLSANTVPAETTSEQAQAQICRSVHCCW